MFTLTERTVLMIQHLLTQNPASILSRMFINMNIQWTWSSFPQQMHQPVQLNVHPRCFRFTFNLHMKTPVPQKKRVSQGLVKNIDIDAFKSDIRSSPLVPEPSDGIVELLQQYNTTQRGLMDKHAPLVTKEVVVRPSTPWVTDSIPAAKRLRRQAERRRRYSSKLTIRPDIYKDACRNVNRVRRTTTSGNYQAEISTSTTKKPCSGSQTS